MVELSPSWVFGELLDRVESRVSGLDDLGEDGDGESGRAPICPECGVTALPGDPSYVVDTRFVCENPDCDAFGEEV